MKKFYLSFIIIFVFLGAIAQNTTESSSIKKHIVGIDNHPQSQMHLTRDVILSEDFETAALPTDWSQVDGDCGWLYGADGSSDAVTFPAHTNYAWVNDDECDGDMSDVQLITPSMNLTGLIGVVLEFASFNHGDEETCTIKASIDGGTNWTDVTTVTQVIEWTTVQIPLTDYEDEADVQIMFHYSDNSVWAYAWAIDDVSVYTTDVAEAGVTNVTPSLVASGESVFPKVTILNNGNTTIDAMDITVVINDGTSDVYTSTLNLTTAGQTTATSTTYAMTDVWTPTDGDYTITATLALVDDTDATNDELVINTEVRALIFGDCVSYFDANDVGCPGIETDGTNIYTAYWGGENIDKYDMDGNYIETFTIAGVSAVRDMAYDGQYFYGAAASTSLFQMDFSTQTLVSTITTATDTRAIAYDDDDNTFWSNNWDSDLTEFGIDGTATGNSFVSPSIYGAAYDNWSNPAVPTMWLFFGTGPTYTETELIEYGLDGTTTGRSIDITTMPGFTNDPGSGSGGLASYEEAGKAYLLANVQEQPNRIYKIYLTDITVGVEEQIASTISVFPNPANNVITITNADKSNITIINMLGAVVSTINNASANQTIDISELTNGTYFVRVNSEVFKINVIK